MSFDGDPGNYVTTMRAAEIALALSVGWHPAQGAAEADRAAAGRAGGRPMMIRLLAGQARTQQVIHGV